MSSNASTVSYRISWEAAWIQAAATLEWSSFKMQLIWLIEELIHLIDHMIYFKTEDGNATQTMNHTRYWIILNYVDLLYYIRLGCFSPLWSIFTPAFIIPCWNITFTYEMHERCPPGRMCLSVSDTNLTFGNVNELRHHIVHVIVLQVRVVSYWCVGAGLVPAKVLRRVVSIRKDSLEVRRAKCFQESNQWDLENAFLGALLNIFEMWWYLMHFIDYRSKIVNQTNDKKERLFIYNCLLIKVILYN